MFARSENILRMFIIANLEIKGRTDDCKRIFLSTIQLHDTLLKLKLLKFTLLGAFSAGNVATLIAKELR